LHRRKIGSSFTDGASNLSDVYAAQAQEAVNLFKERREQPQPAGHYRSMAGVYGQVEAVSIIQHPKLEKRFDIQKQL